MPLEETWNTFARTLRELSALSPNESTAKNLTPHDTCRQQEPLVTHYHNRKARMDAQSHERWRKFMAQIHT